MFLALLAATGFPAARRAEAQAVANPLPTLAPSVPPPVRARWKRGAILSTDYPPNALRDRAGGIVFLRFVVGPTGRVTDCTVTGSSGRADLDAATCRLIKLRLRYAPARDAAGRAVPDVIIGDHCWKVESWRNRRGARRGRQPPPSSCDLARAHAWKGR